MNFPRTLLIACALLALNLQLFSQSHDKDGYYINLKGDTVSGKFLNYKEPSVSPSALSFQATGTSDPISLTPDQCKKASVENDHYISYQGKRQTNSVDYHDDASDTGDVFVDISAFLLELYNDGHYHLFQFNDSKRPNFFVSEGNGPLQELSYKEFMNNGRVVEWPGFRLQLGDLFSPLIQKDQSKQRLIDQTAYNGPALTDLFDQMIGGQNNSSAVPKGKYPGQVFIGIGLSANSLKVTGGTSINAPYDPGQTGTYPSQTTPVFEVGYRLFSQRNEGRIFYTFRLNYYHFQHAQSYQDDIGNGAVTVTYKASAITLPISIGYRLINTQDFNLGLSAGIRINDFFKNTETDTEQGFTNLATTVSDPLINISFLGELSLEFVNRVSIYGAYYSPVSISNSEEYDVKHTSIAFGARVRVF